MTILISYLFGKFKGWLALAGGLIAVIGWAFWQGRREGKQAALDRIHEQDRKLQHEFDKIDAQRPDFDGSIERLRKRAQRKSTPPS